MSKKGNRGWAKQRYYEMMARVVQGNYIMSDIHHTLDNVEIVVEYYLADRLRTKLMYNY